MPLKINCKEITMKKMLEDVWKNNISTSEYNNHIHLISKLTSKRHIEVLQTSIDLEYIFDYENSDHSKYSTHDHYIDDAFECMFCGWYNKNKFKETHFFTKLNSCLKKNKIVYVYLDLSYYVIEKNEKDINEQISHSSALIFYPAKNKRYNVYHFNSHGQTSAYVKQYSKYISRKRYKVIPLNTGLDRYLIGNMVSSYNNHIKEYVDDYTLLNYNHTKKHNYVGTNLQVKDEHGLCYMFPFILFYELNNYYTKQNIVYNEKHRSVLLPCYSRLIKSHKFDIILYLILTKYDNNVGNILYNHIKRGSCKNKLKIKETKVTIREYYLYDKIEDILLLCEEKENYIFKMHKFFVLYMLQRNFKKKSESILKQK